MRRTLVLAMRALAERGIASLLPDLPGQNDSLIATETVDLEVWRAALGAHVAAENTPIVVASVRGGALIDDHCHAAAWWRLAPAEGAGLLRTMLRTRIASDREAGLFSNVEELLASGTQTGLSLAGNHLGPAMMAQLQAAVPAPCTPLRTVMLGSEDDSIAGSPLWLRAEPGEDGAMALSIANDLVEWMATCGVR